MKYIYINVKNICKKSILDHFVNSVSVLHVTNLFAIASQLMGIFTQKIDLGMPTQETQWVTKVSLARYIEISI